MADHYLSFFYLLIFLDPSIKIIKFNGDPDIFIYNIHNKNCLNIYLPLFSTAFNSYLLGFLIKNNKDCFNFVLCCHLLHYDYKIY
jgi:hypothetical protein